MQIIPLSEGRYTIDGTKVFVPFDPLRDDLMQRPRGSLLVEIQPFAVITKKDVIVLDTGLGYKTASGEMLIHENLRKAGIEPEAVTKVLVSHLHKDHAGGILCNGAPAFPRAMYFINRSEWDYAMQTGMPSYQTDDFSELSSFSNVTWLDGKGRIGEDIRYEVCGGHCPNHTVFFISEDSETVFFGGDVAPQWQQMKTRYITKYDAEPRRSMELRQAWWKEGLEKGWKFLFYHDISHPVMPSDN